MLSWALENNGASTRLLTSPHWDAKGWMLKDPQTPYQTWSRSKGSPDRKTIDTAGGTISNPFGQGLRWLHGQGSSPMNLLLWIWSLAQPGPMMLDIFCYGHSSSNLGFTLGSVACQWRSLHETTTLGEPHSNDLHGANLARPCEVWRGMPRFYYFFRFLTEKCWKCFQTYSPEGSFVKKINVKNFSRMGKMLE